MENLPTLVELRRPRLQLHLLRDKSESCHLVAVVVATAATTVVAVAVCLKR